MEGDTKGVTVERKDFDVIVTFRASTAPGHYTLRLRLSDTMGQSSTYGIPYEVVKYSAPTVTGAATTYIVGLEQGAGQLDLTELFAASDALTYTVRSSDETTATASVSGGSTLVITPQRVGTTVIAVTASDGHNTATPYSSARASTKGPPTPRPPRAEGAARLSTRATSPSTWAMPIGSPTTSRPTSAALTSIATSATRPRAWPPASAWTIGARWPCSPPPPPATCSA